MPVHPESPRIWRGEPRGESWGLHYSMQLNPILHHHSVSYGVDASDTAFPVLIRGEQIYHFTGRTPGAPTFRSGSSGGSTNGLFNGQINQRCWQDALYRFHEFSAARDAEQQTQSEGTYWVVAAQRVERPAGTSHRRPLVLARLRSVLAAQYAVQYHADVHEEQLKRRHYRTVQGQVPYVLWELERPPGSLVLTVRPWRCTSRWANAPREAGAET